MPLQSNQNSTIFGAVSLVLGPDCTPAVPPVGPFDDFTEIDQSLIFPGKVLKASIIAALNRNILEATLSPEVFAPQTKTHGQTVALPTSAVDGYTYSRAELTYLWNWANTGPESDIRLPIFYGHVDSATGLVTIHVWRLPAGHPPQDTNDGSISVTVIGSRQAQHPEIIDDGANPPDELTPADAISGAIQLLAKATAFGPSILFSVPVGRGGLYAVNWTAQVSQAATTSSSLGGSTGFQVIYTDLNTGVLVTTPTSQVNAGNTTAAQVSGAVSISVKEGTDVKVQFGYTSSGGTPMQYLIYMAWNEIVSTSGVQIGPPSF